ncbi:MAG: thiamine-phosphate kinase [Cyclobacteriaceae bacterium]|jgi:thiamine-monophosphate kinase|nr:thiamine-phosphate kinase [Flammeovirgaceae bacterium]
MAENRTELNQIGEFGLIERIQKQFSLQNPTSVLGIGDDAAMIDAGQDYLLVTTDMLLEGIHFDLSYMPLQHLGYKAVAVNVSDIAAMNGKPEQITIGLGLSNRFSVEAIDALYSGIQAACENYKVDLVGGDTTASASGLVISITALGRVAKDKVARRSTAKNNDIICVTGDLGAAYMGLQVLEREKQVFLTNPEMQPDLENYEYLVGRQLKPEARMDIVHELAEKNIVPTSMIDISDGLASELMHLGRNSNLGVKIFEENVPIDSMTYETAIEFKLDPITCALNGGEDYELLFTISPADHEKLKNHPDIHFIGHMHSNTQQNVMVTKQQTIVPLKAQGWNHFKSFE